jgi:uncharacterized OsmC-like protein
MSITIQHHEDVRFSAHVGRHQVSIDLPESHGGQDSGMAPPQLFVAALGACAGVYAADHCDSQGIGYQGMRIELDWEIRDRPRRIGGVRVRIELPEAVRMHWTGCPNACGQPYMGQIGLMGAKARKDGQMVEASKIFLGGSIGAEPKLAELHEKGVPLSDLADVLELLLLEQFGARRREPAGS